MSAFQSCFSSSCIAALNARQACMDRQLKDHRLHICYAKVELGKSLLAIMYCKCIQVTVEDCGDTYPQVGGCAA
jgi:hypothetical protein